MLPKAHITSGRRVRMATVATSSAKTHFSIKSELTVANAVLGTIGENIVLEPISIIAGLLKEGGRQGFIIGFVMGVLDIHMVVYLQDDVGSV